MYESQYDYIKNKYDNKSKILFTDADSFIYEIKTNDVYEDFISDKEIIDTRINQITMVIQTN